MPFNALTCFSLPGGAFSFALLLPLFLNTNPPPGLTRPKNLKNKNKKNKKKKKPKSKSVSYDLKDITPRKKQGNFNNLS